MKTITAAVAIIIALGATSASATAGPPPCEYEDSNNCFWDAGESGNGEGHSFYASERDGKVCVYYAEPSYAKAHDYCEPS